MAAGESTTLGGAIRNETREAVSPAVREARVSRVSGDRLLVSVRSLTGDAKPVPVQGYAPHVRDTPGGVEVLEPKRGDRAWIAQDEGGALVVVAWEPVNALARVKGATSQDAKTGLATMTRVWNVAAPYYGRAGQAMPRVNFTTGADAAFVGWSTNPPGDLASILATGRMEWPDWVNRGLIGKNTGDDMDPDGARELLIHEWAHAFQKPGLTMVEAEGGAQAFTRRFAPDIYAAMGIVYVNPPMGTDQYTMPDDTTNSGHPQGATGWVEANRDEAWIVGGQFR